MTRVAPLDPLQAPDGGRLPCGHAGSGTRGETAHGRFKKVYFQYLS
jgi:hypothetical protein